MDEPDAGKKDKEKSASREAESSDAADSSEKRRGTKTKGKGKGRMVKRSKVEVEDSSLPATTEEDDELFGDTDEMDVTEASTSKRRSRVIAEDDEDDES